MKKRMGFVSNSSSSSFVMVGVKVEDIQDFNKFNDEMESKGLEVKDIEDKILVGLTVHDWEYDELIESRQDIHQITNQVATLLDSVGLDSDNIKIFAGTE